MRKILMLAAAALLLLPLAANAQGDWQRLKTGSISFRVGYFYPSGGSDIWELNTYDFTYEVADFNHYIVGFEVNWFATRFITLGLGIDIYSRTVGSEYVDYVDQYGDPIFQEFSLKIIPVTATVKFMPLGNGSPGYRGRRGSPIVPWVGGGVGVYPYTYEEYGSFIDFTDMYIFEGHFITEESAAAFGFHVAGGIVAPMGFDWDVFGEVRYAYVEGDLGDDFLGFEPIDLGGLSVFFGASYRF